MAVSVALASGGRVLKNMRTHRYTPSSPDATAAGADNSIVVARPENFISWWAWGVQQTQDLQAKPPLQIHSQSGDREDWGNASTAIIRGLPFTERFEAYVQHERCFVTGAFTRAMSSLYSRRGRQTDEFKIAYALVSGQSDPEIVRIVLLGSPHREYFEAAAVRALAFIFDKVQAQLAEAKDPPEKAGAA